MNKEERKDLNREVYKQMKKDILGILFKYSTEYKLTYHNEMDDSRYKIVVEIDFKNVEKL